MTTFVCVGYFSCRNYLLFNYYCRTHSLERISTWLMTRYTKCSALFFWLQRKLRNGVTNIFHWISLKFLFITTSWEFLWITKHQKRPQSTSSCFGAITDRVVWPHKIKKFEICCVCAFFCKSYPIDSSNAIPRLPNSTSTNYNKDFTIRFAFSGFNTVHILMRQISFCVCAKTYRKRLFVLLLFCFILLLFCVLFPTVSQ